MTINTVKCSMHLEKFKSWNADPRVIQAVEATCFKWFLRMGDPGHQSLQMITALLFFYNKDSECFQFPKEDRQSLYLDFGLQDILYITGLPIDGIQVSGFEDKDSTKVIKDHFCVDENTAARLFMKKDGKNCEQINPARLMELFQKVPENVTDAAALEPYVKAYLLYLIGVVLFSNNSNSIPVLYIPLLQKDKINKYAWGAALVAYLKRSMRKAHESLIKQKNSILDGFSYAILVFALERFSIFQGSFARPSEFPLFLGWMNTTSAKFKDTQNMTMVQAYKERLERLTEEDICWQPYTLVDCTINLPNECESQLWLIYARVPCICFHEVAMNQPESCFKQLGLEEGDVIEPKELGSDEFRKQRDKRGRMMIQLSKNKDKNWKQCNPFYKCMNHVWTRRNLCILKRDFVFTGVLINDDEVVPSEEQSARVSLKGSSGADNHSEIKKSRKNPVDDHSIPFCATSTNKKQKMPAPETKETLPNCSNELRTENCGDVLSSPEECQAPSMSMNSTEQVTDNARTNGDGMAQSSKETERGRNAQVTGQQVPTAAVEDDTNEDPIEVINVENYESLNHSANVEGESESAWTENLPFRKSSFLWKHFDSLEVFQILPQNPHFIPLLDCNEETR
ncbi:protein MAIN-LIKE 1-like [Euphorbia lathyris]|uniref:protein MAIN-LIKE 1-like n=1 Tax=Euphorbia lathyris TaxID=212925 RepID=UPI00331387DE